MRIAFRRFFVRARSSLMTSLVPTEGLGLALFVGNDLMDRFLIDELASVVKFT